MQAFGKSSEVSTEEGLPQGIQALYENCSSAVFLKRKSFKTTAGVRHGCLLSPTLFNLFLETIMLEILHDHHTSISIGGRPICNLQYADDNDPMGSSNDELQDLTNRLVNRVTAYGMKVSTEKSKIMTKSKNNISAGISMNGQNSEQVTSLKYLGATLYRDGTCSAEIRTRIASEMAAMARRNRI